MKIHINSEDRKNNEISERFSIDLRNIGSRRVREHQIAVTSVQIPLTFYQIRQGYNCEFEFRFSDNSTKRIYIGNIPQVGGYQAANKYDGNPNATVMANNIQSQININTSGQVFTVSINSTTGRLTIRTAASSVFAMTTIDPEIFNVLGFDKSVSTYNTINGILEGSKCINLTPVDCIYIKSSFDFQDDSDFDSKVSGQTNILCKIPTTIHNISMFANLLYEPTVPIYKRVSPVNGNHKFELVYPSGELVGLNNADWSFTCDYQC